MAREFDAVAAGDDEGGGLRAALRFVAWGGIAGSAIALTVLAARTDNGAQRLARLLSGPATAAADSTAVQKTNSLAARLAETESEALRLGETVRRLTADRDRVLARLEALERSADATASIRESAPPATPAQAPATSILTPNPLIPAASPAALPATPNAAPAPRAAATTSPVAAPAGAEQTNLGAIAGPAADSVATKTEFGIDLGGDRTVDALRAIWASLRAGRHGHLFQGLRPVVAIREGGKSGGLELRLVVGPLANAVAAARMCGTLAAAGLACQPTVFDGQRLALR